MVEAFERDVTQRFVVIVVDSSASPFLPFDRRLSAANYLESLSPVPLKADKSRGIVNQIESGEVYGKS